MTRKAVGKPEADEDQGKGESDGNTEVPPRLDVQCGVGKDSPLHRRARKAVLLAAQLGSQG